jgi:hypothetical protein
MGPLAIAALASAGISLGKGIYGGIQASQGAQQERELERNRPDYDIPTSIENLDEVPSMYADYLAEIERRDTMPGQERMEDQIRQSAAQGIDETTKRARTSTEALGAATDIYSDELQQMQQLEIESARQRARQRVNAMQMYGQSRMNVGQLQAQYEDQQFRLNQMEPWMQNMREAQARQQAGYNMIGSAFDNAADAALMYGRGNFDGGGGNQKSSSDNSSSDDSSSSVGDDFMYDYWSNQYYGG